MSERHPEILRATFDECLEDLKRRLGELATVGSPGSGRLKAPLVEVLGVYSDTLQRWLRGVMNPVGENCLRCINALDRLGYRVIELEKMPPGRAFLLRVIACNLRQTKDLVAQLQMRGSSDLYAFVLGKMFAGRHADQLEARAFQLCQPLQEEVSKRLTKFDKKLAGLRRRLLPSSARLTLAVDDKGQALRFEVSLALVLIEWVEARSVTELQAVQQALGPTDAGRLAQVVQSLRRAVSGSAKEESDG